MASKSPIIGSFDMKLADLIMVEHNYSKREDHGCSVKPTKTLFSFKRGIQHEEEVDVTTVAPHPNTQYDQFKALELMEECKRFVIFARVPRANENTDDWEDTITKTGWSPDQDWLFKKVTEILHADRLARLALEGTWSEPAKRRAHVDRTAQRFRNAMSTIAWDLRLSQWLHTLLIDNLDISYLAAYVDILQTLKVRVPTLIDRLLDGAVYGKTPLAQQGMNLLIKRPWDPALSTINAQKLVQLPGSPVIVLIPSSLKRSQPTPRCNLWSSHLSSLATLVTVNPIPGVISPRMTPQAYLEQMVSATKTRLTEVRCDYPGRPLVLVGWRSGAAIALQTASTEPVFAVVSLGLSTRTVEGPRGDPDDPIYNVTCPVLFVTGEHASTARPEDLDEIRLRMLCCTEQVVVGKCDDCLRMSKRHRIALGVTQSLVDRAVLEAVGEFLANTLLKPPSARPPSPINPSTTRVSYKRGHSIDGVENSDNSLKQSTEPVVKQSKLTLSPAFNKVNGTSSTLQDPPRTPLKRGRKPGSLNKSPKVPKTMKTLQTIAPIKKASPTTQKEVNVELGTMGSLGVTGPITRDRSTSTLPKPSPANRPGAATFRIHAGRVSAACVNPADVMPPRSSDAPLLFGALGKPSTAGPSKGGSDHSPGIMTVSPVSMPQPVRVPTPASRVPTNSPPSTMVAPSPRTASSPHRARFTFNSATRPMASPTNKGVIRMSQRASSLVASSGALTLAASPTRVIRSQVKGGSPVFTVPKRTASVPQKPIIVKSRVRKSEEVPYAFMQSCSSSDQTDQQYFVQKCSDSDSSIVMMNRGHSNVITKVGEPKKQATLVLKDRIKEHVRLSGSGDHYILQNRRSSGEELLQERGTYYVNYPSDEHDTLIYEVIEN